MDARLASFASLRPDSELLASSWDQVQAEAVKLRERLSRTSRPTWNTFQPRPRDGVFTFFSFLPFRRSFPTLPCARGAGPRPPTTERESFAQCRSEAFSRLHRSRRSGRQQRDADGWRRGPARAPRPSLLLVVAPQSRGRAFGSGESTSYHRRLPRDKTTGRHHLHVPGVSHCLPDHKRRKDIRPAARHPHCVRRRKGAPTGRCDKNPSDRYSPRA